ncbi:MAG: hypothetical protein IKC48_02815, partial [Clostridia bacterium]|nr:hypothetical protein [Clostridia bacterium]
LGTTFAWFTDSAESKGNIIQTGTLDVAMHWADGDEDPASATWNNAESGAIFGYANWEPGYTEARHIRIANAGSLALKYQLRIVANGEVGKLAEVIDVYYFEQAKQLAREDAMTGEKLGTLKDVIANRVLVNGELAAECNDTITLVFKMGEEVTNEYQGLSLGCNFSVQVVATQLAAEEDSFGKDYDDGADYEGEISSAESFVAALASGGSFKLVGNVTLDTSATIAEGTTVSLDLGGHSIIAQSGNAIVNNGTLIINGVPTLTARTIAPVASSTIASINAYAILNNGELTLNGVTVDGGISNGGALTINSGKVYTTRGGYSHAIYHTGNSLVINGGSFSGNGNEVISDQSKINGTVVINGGTFDKVEKASYLLRDTKGTMVINGGTFYAYDENGTDPAGQCVSGARIYGGAFNYNPTGKGIASGYHAVEHNGLWYVLTENVDSIIMTANDLYALGGTTVSGECHLLGDIDMSGFQMKSLILPANGELTFVGNGHTISNLTLVTPAANGMTGAGGEVAGLFDVTENSGCTLTVNDLALENVSVECSGFAAAVVGYANSKNDVIALNNVDVRGASVTSDTVAALVGYTVAPLALTNCDVFDITLVGEEGRPDKVGAFVGTANQATCSVTTVNCNNNTEYREYGRVINSALWNGNVHASSAAELSKLANEEVSERTIVIDSDITGDITVVQKPNVKITIDGNGYKFSGVLLVDGKSARYDSAALTIKNFNFEADSLSADAYIRLGNGTNATRYTNHVTVESCTFKFSGSKDVAAVKSYTGGDLNLTISGCTAYAGMHSLAQLYNIEEGLTITNCFAYSKNGVNMNSTLGLEMSGCTFEVRGYAIRFGASGGANTTEKIFNIKDSTLKSACEEDDDAVIIFRGTSVFATLNLVDTTLDGSVKFKGNTSQTEITNDGVTLTFASNQQDYSSAIEELNSADAAVTEKEIILSSGSYESNFRIAGGKDVVIEGCGEDTVLNGQIATTASNEGKLVLRNLTINVSSAISDSTGISQTSKSAIAIWGDQTVICENVTFNMDLADSTAITSWWDTGKGTTIIVRNCVFNCNGQRPIRATGNVTVEGCTFNDPYRYAVQLTAKASTATELEKAIINFNNNTIINGENGKAFVYGIQLEGADYGCHDCVINGSGNTIVNGGADSAMYYCECGKVQHDTIEWNVEVEPVHEA